VKDIYIYRQCIFNSLGVKYYLAHRRSSAGIWRISKYSTVVNTSINRKIFPNKILSSLMIMTPFNPSLNGKISPLSYFLHLQSRLAGSWPPSRITISCGSRRGGLLDASSIARRWAAVAQRSLPSSLHMVNAWWWLGTWVSMTSAQIHGGSILILHNNDIAGTIFEVRRSSSADCGGCSLRWRTSLLLQIRTCSALVLINLVQ
jgi:hypothetical protein